MFSISLDNRGKDGSCDYAREIQNNIYVFFKTGVSEKKLFKK